MPVAGNYAEQYVAENYGVISSNIRTILQKNQDRKGNIIMFYENALFPPLINKRVWGEIRCISVFSRTGGPLSWRELISRQPLVPYSFLS